MANPTEDFEFDVFLSHSSKDNAVVRAIAVRLREDGLHVWFDERQKIHKNNVAGKIEEGLRRSRTLVFCMSKSAFGADWTRLEGQTFWFRDPLNKKRRFVPLRLDDAPIENSLTQFLYIDWRPNNREHQYEKLLAACRPPTPESEASERTAANVIKIHSKETFLGYAFSSDGSLVLSGGEDKLVRLSGVELGRCLRVFEGHTDQIFSVAWSGDKRLALSGGTDSFLRVWDAETGRCLHKMDGHKGMICGIAGAAGHALSASEDQTVRLWDVNTGRCLRVFEGHSNFVWSVAWSTDQKRALSGSYDNTMRLWDVQTGKCLRVFEGHTGGIPSVAWGPDDRYAASGSHDNTLRLWDLATGRCLRVLEGHTDSVFSVSWNPSRTLLLSGSWDKTARLWDLITGRCLCVLAGPADAIRGVAWSPNGCHAYTGDTSGEIRTWDLSEFSVEAQAPHAAMQNLQAIPQQVQYTNAKVLLVGDSGVGKTGLAKRLTHRNFEETTSTDGAWATQWALPNARPDVVDREIWLWDFAGQVDYRLVHQLFMDDTAAAVLVFNPQSENPFEGLGQWDYDLQKASRRPFAKLLAAGRIDRGGLVVSRASMDRFMLEREFLCPLYETSARTGEGCDELRDAIVASIDWQNIPATTSPVLYQRMKEEILHMRDSSGMVLLRLAELKQRMEFALPGERFEPTQLETVVGLLSGPGMIQGLHFGSFILLKPEVLSRYAAAVVRTVRKHPQELGCIREDDMLAGNLDYQDFERLPREDEAVVLHALQETFVSRAWCLRQPTASTALLTFPSYFRRERPEQIEQPNALVTYRFMGPVDDIYATLVVRLHHTEAFETHQLWRFAADFKTQIGKSLGFKLVREAEGVARLDVYFSPEVDENSRLVFLRYVHNHLSDHAQNVVRRRHYTCANIRCDARDQAFTDQSKIDRALAPGGRGKVFCSGCGKAIYLRDALERKFDAPAVKEQARQMQVETSWVIDNESRELILVGHAFAISAEAAQIYRGYTNSDHGIDGEIEFKDDNGRASGKRLYLQLKSGDSYLKKRQHDNAEVFQIKNLRWVEYWQQQAYPVMLVIRNSEGEIRWMDVSNYLKRIGRNGQRAVRQVKFDGERFDVMSVRRWRDKVLGKAEIV